MTDDQHATEHPGDPRLQFSTGTAAPAILDGAWWPQSRRSEHELAALVAELDSRHADVRVLMLNPHGWLGRPRRIALPARTVRVEWIEDLDRGIVIGATAAGRRIDLLMVAPPAAPPPAAPVADDGPPSTLAVSISAVSRALSSGSPAWVEDVRCALVVVLSDLRQRRSAVNSPAGPYRHAVARAPRLTGALAKLGEEQAQVTASLERTLDCIAEPVGAAYEVRVRTRSVNLLRRLTKYQEHDADLLHQATEVDLGGQG